MKITHVVAIVGLASTALAETGAVRVERPRMVRTAFSTTIQPVFEANRGQFPTQIRFVGRHFRTTVWWQEGSLHIMNAGRTGDTVIRFPGSNIAAEPQFLQPSPGITHYLTGRHWSSLPAVANYERVKVPGIYKGVDLILYSNSGNLEFDFALRPNADSRQIRIRLPQSESVRWSTKEISFGDFKLRAPLAYQMDNARRRQPVEMRLERTGRDFGFSMSRYDAERELVIDPVLEYGSVLGGSGDDEIVAVAVDSDNNPILGGTTSSPNFPGSPAGSRPAGKEAFVMKLDRQTGKPAFTTYFGGQGTDSMVALRADVSGIYIAGDTNSRDLPTPNGFQKTLRGGTDLFIAKLNTTGSALIFATYLGGSQDDNLGAMEIDSRGNIYIGASTFSSNFPILPTAAKRTISGIQDAVAVKLNASGAGLDVSTYIGGSGGEFVTAIAVDASDSIYVAGITGSTNFPTTADAFQKYFGGGSSDGFFLCLNPFGSEIRMANYVGGNATDGVQAMRLYPTGEIAIAGITESTDFITIDPAFDRTPNGGRDGFLRTYTPDGGRVYGSTLFGGTGDETVWGMDLLADRILLVGQTGSLNFPTTANALQPSSGGGKDGFISLFTFNAATLAYSSYYGGRGDELLRDVKVLSGAKVLLTGTVTPALAGGSIPTTSGAYQTALQGGTDALVLRMDFVDVTKSAVISPAGVVGAGLSFNSVNLISPLGLASIFGAGFSPDNPQAYRQVAAADLNGQQLPTNLGGVCVEIGGRRAPVVFWSDQQINFQVPEQVTAGETHVRVLTKCGSGQETASNEIKVPSGPLAPEFFYFAKRVGGANAVAAQSAFTGESIGPADLLPGVVMTPARPGDIVTLYATGLGLVNPALSAGKLAAGTAEAVSPITIQLGGFQLNRPDGILYAGLVPGFAGLYQINIRIPSAIATGLQPIEINMNGVRSPGGPYLAIQR